MEGVGFQRSRALLQLIEQDGKSGHDANGHRFSDLNGAAIICTDETPVRSEHVRCCVKGIVSSV
jgi:hypothetical protein